MATYSIWNTDGSFLEVFIGDEAGAIARRPAGGAHFKGAPMSPEATFDGEQIVEPDPVFAERKTMNPWRRAFRFAMRSVPPPAGPAPHLLSFVVAAVEIARDADEFDDVVMWYDTVIIIERSNSDMDQFRDEIFVKAGLSASVAELKIDALCRLAVAIENGESDQRKADLIAAYKAIV